MKRALHRGGAETLNIYTTTASAYLGWAYLPDIVTKPGQEYLDGIVVDWESMPGASTTYAGRYDLGHTATHEAGHWFDLEHTFFGGCNAKGDFVDDTPAAAGADAAAAPTGQDTCRRAGGRPDPQLHGLLVRRLLLGVHGGPAQRMRDAWLLCASSASTTDARRAGASRPVFVPATLRLSQRP